MMGAKIWAQRFSVFAQAEHVEHSGGWHWQCVQLTTPSALSESICKNRLP